MKTPFITEAEAIKEDFKGRTNYWMCHPDITNAKDLQICRAVLPAGAGWPGRGGRGGPPGARPGKIA